MGKSTKMGPGGNMGTNNNSTSMFNMYTSGSGVGASSIASHRAKNRLAGVYTSAPACGVINIASIATNTGGNTYTLNGNYTITACQILNIPVGTTLNVSAGQTLTNNGIINNSGYILIITITNIVIFMILKIRLHSMA